MPAILYPLSKIVKNFNTIVFTGGTVFDSHGFSLWAAFDSSNHLLILTQAYMRNETLQSLVLYKAKLTDIQANASNPQIWTEQALAVISRIPHRARVVRVLINTARDKRRRPNRHNALGFGNFFVFMLQGSIFLKLRKNWSDLSARS
jgi:hypothetical protein